ncbi:hypothetical protein RIR_jg34300.t1 [Rhizophagus irregularis DAOM 181602=DAOM 197198]|nr:hypothetical protein RIR_jg34300.t1 [Rhizophagus irregularis DAOM 181602=DAOM 197198]
MGLCILSNRICLSCDAVDCISRYCDLSLSNSVVRLWICCLSNAICRSRFETFFALKHYNIAVSIDNNRP